MPGLVIVGAQWGDEGKGKLVDALTTSAEMVVRFQGGNNAGHTIVSDGQVFKLSLIPSGILYPSVHCLLAAGTVIDAQVFSAELDKLGKLGLDISPKRLFVDLNAQLVMPYHRLLDQAQEAARGSEKIGTTGKGIGPAYVDRAARCGIRVVELRRPELIRTRLKGLIEKANQQLLHVWSSNLKMEFAEAWQYIQQAAETLLPYLKDGSELVENALFHKRRVIFEGAQGSLLDQMHGTIPFVTSSNTIAGAAAVGTGIGPNRIGFILGICKAYCTRVGSGPFLTEDLGSAGNYLREKGHEFGTVTGRPRRCGWLDIVALRRAIRLNGIDALAITKLDVLEGLPQIKVADSYLQEAKVIATFPATSEDYLSLVPNYLEFPGWSQTLSSREVVCPEMGAYLKAVADLSQCPIAFLSIGAERKALLEWDGHLKFQSFWGDY